MRAEDFIIGKDVLQLAWRASGLELDHGRCSEPLVFAA